MLKMEELQWEKNLSSNSSLLLKRLKFIRNKSIVKKKNKQRYLVSLVQLNIY